MARHPHLPVAAADDTAKCVAAARNVRALPRRHLDRAILRDVVPASHAECRLLCVVASITEGQPAYDDVVAGHRHQKRTYARLDCMSDGPVAGYQPHVECVLGVGISEKASWLHRLERWRASQELPVFDELFGHIGFAI